MISLVDAAQPLSAAFEAAYAELSRNYRCEYVYKTALINHALRNDPAVNTITGLPVFLSIADLIVAGGAAAAAYEIKTDLDSFARLEDQLFSYSRCFEKVYLVASTARAHGCVDELPAHVGVLAIDDSTRVDEIRPAEGGHSRLEIATLFRVLRQDERIAILARQLDYTRDVPSGLLYRHTFELFTELPLDIAYPEFVGEMCRRDSRQRAAVRQAALPTSLLAAAAGLSLSGVAWRRLGERLHRPISELAVADDGQAA
ncbi:sce7726 family protein [Mycobacteroides abscessus]|uniref:sce7726 family protein n=1 Tax=Mycobacteroides abscessus TaxID=36809 RepID=UPI001F371BBB|nr:sce7726 family protein [Mycobacteroides abscessus]